MLVEEAGAEACAVTVVVLLPILLDALVPVVVPGALPAVTTVASRVVHARRPAEVPFVDLASTGIWVDLFEWRAEGEVLHDGRTACRRLAECDSGQQQHRQAAQRER